MATSPKDQESLTTSPASAPSASVDTQECDGGDHSRHIITDMYGEDAYQSIEQWCHEHQFKIGNKISEHVISITRVAPQPTAEDISAAHVSERDRSRGGSSREASQRSAERIFNVALGIESDEVAEGDLDAATDVKSRCAICTELARMSRFVDLKCEKQYLLLCPDCVLAHCAPSDADEHARDYIVVYCVAMDAPPILDIVGKWSFEYIQRIKFNRGTREGFIAFRTFVVYNIARICPISHYSSEDAQPMAPAAPASSGSKIFHLLRKSTKTKATSLVPVDLNYFIIRIRSDCSHGGIRLIRANTFADALCAMTPVSKFDDDMIREIESATLNIFAQEPRLVYHDVTFAPPPAVRSEPAFNYWRGWSANSSALISRGPIDMSINGIIPIINFINQIWCADLGTQQTPANNYALTVACRSPVPLCDKARFIISWFAHIIQSPGSAPERQMIFRGFPPDLVAPLLEFIGRDVIGEQYFDKPIQPEQSGIAKIRADCLFAFVGNCPVKNLKGIMRESRGIWAATDPQRGRKLSIAEKLAQQRGQKTERTIDTSKMLSGLDAHKLLRVAVHIAASISIPPQRRRFGIIDFAGANGADDSIINSRAQQLANAINADNTAEYFFQFLAQFQPLTLFWDT